MLKMHLIFIDSIPLMLKNIHINYLMNFDVNVLNQRLPPSNQWRSLFGMWWQLMNGQHLNSHFSNFSLLTTYPIIIFSTFCFAYLQCNVPFHPFYSAGSGVRKKWSLQIVIWDFTASSISHNSLNILDTLVDCLGK